MAVPVTAIHVFLRPKQGVDARDKPAHDGVIQHDRNMLQSMIFSENRRALFRKML
ncbi:MAG TPA: hypothetical protein VGH49_00800 [Xanthobacteraceae bacterium]